jgi:hypothetical protein
MTLKLVLALLLAAGACVSPAPEPGACAPLQHACECATGSYCVAAGAACLTPQAPCPDSPPDECDSSQHACTCATGSYCLPIGAACIVPTSPCPQ